MPKSMRAVELRDLAVTVIRAHGVWQPVKGGPTLLVFRTDPLIIAYRTPFQKLPQRSGEFVRKSVAFGIMPGKTLPYGLDIGTPRKVLNVEWSDDGDVLVVSYKAGEWERELETLAAE